MTLYIFGATNRSLCKDFSNTMQSAFEMTMMGELPYFTGLQIHQTKKGIIFINQSKYCKELLRNFGMNNSKEIATPLSTSCYLDKNEECKLVEVNSSAQKNMGLWYPKGTYCTLVGYSDSEFVGCKMD